MSRARYLLCLLAVTGCSSLILALSPSTRRAAPMPHPRLPGTHRSGPLSLPLTFEANWGQAGPNVSFLVRGPRLTAFLARDGIAIEPAGAGSKTAPHPRIRIEFSTAPTSTFTQRIRVPAKPTIEWKGIDELRAQSNYFIGRDPALWLLHVPHFASAKARSVLPGVDAIVYGNYGQLEFDLQVAPGVDTRGLRIRLSGADSVRLNADGDLLIRLAGAEFRMRKPALYEEVPGRELASTQTAASRPPLRFPIDGGYFLEPDGWVGFRIANRRPNAALVIDPSLSVAYSTFLGGFGEDVAESIAVDSGGKMYVGGITSSASTFGEIISKQNGPGGGPNDFFVAKIDPTISGPASLLYLTFLGGTGDEAGGTIAVDKSGNLAITGTTTSADFPVTDGSVRTSGANDLVVSELGPTGATLVYSTLFGGSGSESTQNPGGVALDQSGEIFVASDTTSTDLPVTASAYQIANGGGISDGFLAVFRPTITPHLKYCTYLGISSQLGVGGVAVDAGGNAYIAGFTSDPGATFPTLNGYQTTYAGDPFDAFVIKIRPSGTGASDLAYATLLGGAGLDKALAITVGAAMPATAYVTGTTQSTNFPTNGTNAAAQTIRKGTANAFLAAIAQDATTGMTSLLYSTYLGGTQSDSGLGVSAAAPTAVYVAGKTTSWDFPWLDNFQPFNGTSDAFVAKFNPTVGGSASLIYATPIGGTAPPGGTAVTDANSIVAGPNGQVFVAGRTTAADFPRAPNPGNGLQPICSSCQQSPPAADAFVLAFLENAAPTPAVSFTALNLNFGSQSVGAQNVPPLFASLVNTGDSPLNVSNIAVAGRDSASFSFVGSDPCIGIMLAPAAACTFEVSFSPGFVGSAVAFVSVSDNAPGTPQVLALVGVGSGPLAVLSTSSIDFGSQPEGSASGAQTVEVRNAGNQNLLISNILLSGADLNQFSLPAASCGLSIPIPPGGVCQISEQFSPPGLGLYQAEIDVTDNSGGIASAKQVILLSGTGVAAAPIANLLPASLSFGSLAVGAVSGSQSVTLRNTGSTALTLSHVALAGTGAASFGFAPSGTTCPTQGGTLPIGGSCTVAINFAPQSGGSQSASLNFVDNAAGSPQLIALTGTAIAPVISISPSGLNFAAQSVGTPSASQTITLSNTGSSTVAINQISFTGANASDFSETSNCSSALGPGSSCLVSVIFKPVAAGNRSASILISDDAAGNPHTVPLAGTATQAAVSPSPTGVNFGPAIVGAPTQPVAITITNSGSGALVISSISFSGANPTDFQEKDTCKSSIAPAATCVINVTFTPGSVGARAATLVLVDNAPNTPQSIPLTGTAMDFDIDPPGIGSTVASVPAGQTAVYKLDVESKNGFAATVSLSCAWVTAQPAGTSCTITPATLPVGANGMSSFEVDVTTTARQLASQQSPKSSAREQPLLAVQILLLLAAAMLVLSKLPIPPTPPSPPFSPLPQRRRAPAFARIASALALLLLLAATQIACASGNGGAPTNATGTPAGVSTLSIVASTPAASSTTSRTLQLTLTVD